MNRFRKPLLFSLAVLPVAVIAVICTCLHQFDLYPAEILEEAAAQIGSMELVLALSVVQNAGLVFVCSFFGYILADKTGLWKPLRPEKDKVRRTLLLSVLLGFLFSLDPWIFGGAAEGIREATAVGMTFTGVLAAVLYGGLIEEILLRLFFLSLLVFLIRILFLRKRENIPAGVFAAANIIAALLFAAGHLPATVMTFGELTPLLLFRCFLFNGGFGLAFGWLYCRYGLMYAVLGHGMVHVVSRLIWSAFL